MEHRCFKKIFPCSGGFPPQSLKPSFRDWLANLLLPPQHHWSPPKGHLDQLADGCWESEVTAALRETEEEAGIRGEQLEVHMGVKAELRWGNIGQHLVDY